MTDGDGQRLRFYRIGIAPHVGLPDFLMTFTGRPLGGW